MRITKAIVKRFEENQKHYGTKMAIEALYREFITDTLEFLTSSFSKKLK